MQSYQRLVPGTIAPRQISVKSNYERNVVKLCRILCGLARILRMMIASWAENFGMEGVCRLNGYEGPPCI